MDLIDRQAAIDAVLGACKDTATTECAVRELEELPSAQPERKTNEWIPVAERLPNKPNVYTVTDSKGDVVRFAYTGTDSSRKYWLRCARAWMPLPEPYAERRTDE